MTDFAKTLLHICKRPNLYTMGGTFREVVAYISGFDSIRARSPGEYYGINFWGREIDHFGKWLADRSGTTQRVCWFEILLEYSGGDDQLALSQLDSLYREFVSSPIYQRFEQNTEQNQEG